MDVEHFLCSGGSGFVGSTPDYEPVPSLPPEAEPVTAPFRERLLNAVKRGGVFRCLTNELGQWNVEPGVYHHMRGANGPQRPGAEAILLELEHQGRIKRASYWGPKSLEHFASATLYTWRASTRAWSLRAAAVSQRVRRRNERKFTSKLRERGRSHV